ncbi:MAG TPA: M56 family metallopeptidase [Mycobacteriales bacterium]|nr:M56 family metallopeptidase [Mycobacteriales bacterium]
MLPAAAAQALALLALTAAVPRLACAGWPLRAPAPALLLWQALGLAGGLLALEVAATVALAPLGGTFGEALAELPAPLTWWAWAAALVFVAVLGRLVTVLLASTARTVRDRHRHRVLVDLLATRNPLLRGTSVLTHDVPVAYCLPGLRPRVVVSSGVLAALDEPELRAVLDHELAHITARHDLVVLPFVALGATFPRLTAVRVAREQVALLVEMLADDRAVRRHDGRVLARALCKVGTAQAPAGGLGSGGSGVLLRADRLLDPPPPLTRLGLAAVLLGVLLVLALPVAGVLLPRL